LVGEKSPKAHRRGSHRAVTPEETIDRLRPRLRQLGITRVADLTGLDRIGVPTIQVIRPNGRALSTSQGKGTDKLSATASGLMEAVETWHAERVEWPLRFASFLDLRETDVVVDPSRLLRSGPFDPDRPLPWTRGVELRSRVQIWVPYELISTDYRVPAPAGFGVFRTSSTGLAAGNTGLEAIIQAVCEAIERDAFTGWMVAGEGWRADRRVDLASVGSGDVGALIEKVRAAGLDVGLWDITSDIGVAAFLCQIEERLSDGGVFAAAGSGCHPCREIAALRAITEACQSRVTTIAGARDDLDDEAFQPRRESMLSEAGNRAFTTTPTLDSDDMHADLGHLLDHLTKAGLAQAIIVDLTREEIGIPVVKAIVPGLEDAVGVGPSYEPGPRALKVFEASR
jgi:ribosomal protein S12 methylthiotransferase accessory factor